MPSATKCEEKKRKILLFDGDNKINNNTTTLLCKGLDSKLISKSVKQDEISQRGWKRLTSIVEANDSKKLSHRNKRSLCRNGDSETTIRSSFEDSCRSYDKVKRSATFPHIIHDMVSYTARTKPHIIDWIENGEAFLIHDTGEPLGSILREYFGHGKYSSLQRQLNMYGWKKCSTGAYKGGFYHPNFHRDNKSEFHFALIKRSTSTKERRKDKKKRATKTNKPQKLKDEHHNKEERQEIESIPIDSKFKHVGDKKTKDLKQQESPKCVSKRESIAANSSLKLEMHKAFCGLHNSPIRCKESLKKTKDQSSSNVISLIYARKFYVVRSGYNHSLRKSNTKPTLKKFIGVFNHEERCSLGSKDVRNQKNCPTEFTFCKAKLPSSPMKDWRPYDNLRQSDASSCDNSQANEDSFHYLVGRKEESEAKAAALVLSTLSRSE